MNNPITKTILAASLALGVLAAPVTSHAEREQPNMDKAIELLQKAKTEANPVPALEKAREHVKDAKHDKGGRRPEAVKEINEAIEIAKSGGKPEAKINHAISLVRSGEDHGR